LKSYSFQGFLNLVEEGKSHAAVSREHRGDAGVECGVWLNAAAQVWPNVPVVVF